MNCEAVLGCFPAAEPLCVNCDPPDGFPSMNFFGGGLGAGANKLFVLANRFDGAEPMRLNSDGLLDGTGVTVLAGCIGLLFSCGTIVVPPEGVGLALELYFDDPSDLDNAADDPGSTRSDDADPVDEPDEESVDVALELCFEAKGFRLLSQPARAGEIAAHKTASTRESRPIAVTVPNPCIVGEGKGQTVRWQASVAPKQRRRSGDADKIDEKGRKSCKTRPVGPEQFRWLKMPDSASLTSFSRPIVYFLGLA